MSFTPAPHKLRWPLALASGESVDELPIRPILHGPHRDALKRLEGQDDDKIFLALAALATGLEETDLQNLKRPDYNGLSQRVFELVSKDADYFRDGEAGDPDAPELLVPITGKNGAPCERVELEVPSTGTTLKMKAITDTFERAEFITASCTGLIVQQLDDLTVPDWNTLQGRIDDFLNQTGDFFRQGTSMS